MWTSYFDKIFLINLAKRTDRLEQATRQLNHYNIPFERVEAIEMLDGAEGLRQTMIKLFERVVENEWKNILIFEDDLDIICPEINKVMEAIIPAQLPDSWDMIYLGCQVSTLPRGFFWRNVLKLHRCQSTHAVAYSLECVKEIMKTRWGSDVGGPIDNWLTGTIQPRGRIYATYPMLVSQIVSKSDIYSDQPLMNWKKWLEELFDKQMERMKERGIFDREPKNLY